MSLAVLLILSVPAMTQALSATCTSMLPEFIVIVPLCVSSVPGSMFSTLMFNSPAALTVVTLVVAPLPSQLKSSPALTVASPMFTTALTVMLDDEVGMVKLLAVLIVAAALNITKPLFTRVPAVCVYAASNCSVPSVSTTVIVPPVCVSNPTADKGLVRRNVRNEGRARDETVIGVDRSGVPSVHGPEMSRVEL